MSWVSILYNRLLIPLLQLKRDFMQHHENPIWDLVDSGIPVAAQTRGVLNTRLVRHIKVNLIAQPK